MDSARSLLMTALMSLERRLTGARHARHARLIRRHARVDETLRVIGAPHVECSGLLEIGPHFVVHSLPVQTHLVIRRGAALQIGRDVHIAHGCGIACHSHIEIGDGTQLRPFVMVLDTDYHVPGDPTARPVPLPIKIGRGVRIGTQVTILRGSVIGDGAVIEPGSVVSGEVPAFSHVSGVPARLVVQETAHGERGTSVEQRVIRVAMQAFRLQTEPSLDDGPNQIGAWNSLGALSLLVGLEEEFGCSFSEQDAQAVRTLGDIVRMLSPRVREAA